jgi:anti-sigma regulatory factor (Ser/Thr protein kinase)
MADSWPLRSSLELGALPGAVPSARLHARHVLWEWGLTALSEVVELLVSELVTNAVHASQSMEWIFPVRLRLLSDLARVLILVSDANPRPPVRADAGENDESGRGLVLVETFSTQWGWDAEPDAAGKVVWCLVTALPASPGRPAAISVHPGCRALALRLRHARGR